MADHTRRNFSNQEVTELVDSLKQALAHMTIDEKGKVLATWEDWCSSLAREVAKAVLNTRPKK